MKARIPPQRRLSREMRKVNDDYINKSKHDACNRFIKVAVFVLNRNFGLGNRGGNGRLSRFVNLVLDTFNSNDNDVAFWVNLDKVVIDELKLPFAREDYEEREEAMEQWKRKK